MLAIEAITRRIHSLAVQALPEFENRIHINRTSRLSTNRDELPAICIEQGSEAPETNLSDWQFAGWVCNVDILLTVAGADEDQLVTDLNTLRLRILQALMAGGARLGLDDLVVETQPGSVSKPVSDSDGSVIVKDLLTNWQIAYRIPRNNYDVSI